MPPADRRQRVALAVDPSTPEHAGVLAALVELVRRDVDRWSATLIVLPTLDPAATQRLVDVALDGCDPSISSAVAVEPAATYLERGHDVALGAHRPWAGLMHEVVQFGRDGVGPEEISSPSQVLAHLAHLVRPESPSAEAPPRVSALLAPDRMIAATSWGTKILLDPHDISLTPDIVLRGHYDPVLLRFLELTVRPGDCCADVGANIGLFTLRMAELAGPGGFVHAFEPVARIRELCATTLQINYVSAWTRVDHRAVSDVAGSTTMHVSTRAQGNSSLIPHTDDYRRRFPLDTSTTTEVETVRLDEALAPRFHRLVKVDVEGAERRVLDGMSGLIEAGRVGTIVIELVRANAPDDWPNLRSSLQRLETRGARFGRLDVSGRRVTDSLRRLLDREPMPHLVIDLPV